MVFYGAFNSCWVLFKVGLLGLFWNFLVWFSTVFLGIICWDYRFLFSFSMVKCLYLLGLLVVFFSMVLVVFHSIGFFLFLNCFSMGCSIVFGIFWRYLRSSWTCASMVFIVF